MKMIFICGSLEPGKDGVGDYIRRLASELIKDEHQVSVIAFYDRYALQKTEILHSINEKSFQMMRLPASLPAKQRLLLSAALIRNFNPDWISLQYVGFGFHKYGLPIDLFKLRNIINDAKLHIMFHELWCGMSPLAGVKERILGRLQMAFIKLLVLKLKPAKVFTNVAAYSDYLKQFQITSTLAPIFGNIETSDIGSEEEWLHLTQKISITDLQKKDWFIVGFFGAVYPCTGLEPLIGQAAQYAESIGKKFGILRIGKENERLQNIINNIKNVHYWTTGILVPAMVNRLMNYVDCGVITTPANKLDKSGSAIAWLERGIPVLIVSEDDTYIEEEMFVQGIVQVKDASDIDSALRIEKNLIKQDGRLQKNAQLYASLG
jgi:hypothetical protein